MNISKPCKTKLHHSKVRLCFSGRVVKGKNAFIEQLNNEDDDDNNNDNDNNNNNNVSRGLETSGWHPGPYTQVLRAYEALFSFGWQSSRNRVWIKLPVVV